MLVASLSKAMRRAHYQILEDSSEYYGEIPGFQGVYATGTTLEACREDLAEALEEWVLLRVSRSLPLPEVDGVTLAVQRVS